MKKLHSLLLATLVMLAGCGEINDRLDALEGRVDAIEDTQIATISQQITSINNSILLLNNTDKELGEYIAALEAEAENLQTQITATNTKIDEVKTEVLSTISSEKANILGELEAFKATVNGELDAIKAVLETLKAKDVELDGKIATLQEYVDTELKATEDWATATFATLEQNNEVVATIATIEGTIKGINESIAALETRINEKIAKDIETACATLSTDLQNTVKEVTEAYTSAIATAKNELTEAYTTALEGAISALETSMKEWVNEQLTAYSTIVSTEAKITALQSEMDGKLAAQKTYLEALVNALSSSVTTDITAIKKQIKDIEEAIAKNAEDIEALRGELAKQKAELTEAYTVAIAEAIATAKGEMSEELAAEIAAINERIDKSDIAAIEALIANCKARMETAEADIVQLKSDVLQLQVDVEELQEITEKLLAQIQSITYIPTYDDGKATIDYHSKRGTLDFQISPKSAIKDLEKVWQTALSVKAVATQTRAVEFINLPITAFEADATNGTITIEVDGTNLGDAFFAEKSTASATIEVSDGNNCINSNYINIVVQNHNVVKFQDSVVESLCLLNWDTNKDNKLTLDETASISSIEGVFSDMYKFRISYNYMNEYKAVDVGFLYWGNHYITSFNELSYFSGLQQIPNTAFTFDINLTQISIPLSVSIVENGEVITVKATNSDKNNYDSYINFPKVYYGAFSNTALKQITLPENLIQLGSYAFYDCKYLREVYCKATTPPSLGSDVFYGTADDLTIYVPMESVDLYKSKWKSYASRIVGYDFE
ncbi:MAG: leucine-rich repeat protein [Tidjanibacter sp.]|nr:leucine-rich repeat protein [Tidjanibacter sp.]